jgi:3-keto-5-aminohexanoate cleavage enzyme
MCGMRSTLPRATVFIPRLRSTNRGSHAPAPRSRAAGVKAPIYRFMFSEQFAFGFPPKPYAPAAHLALLEQEAGPAPWMIAGLGADIRPLIGEAVARGGHVRVGPEDAKLGTAISNLVMVEQAVRMVRDHGAEPASAAELRRALGTLPCT